MLGREAKLLETAHCIPCPRHTPETHSVYICECKVITVVLFVIEIEYIAWIVVERQYPFLLQGYGKVYE